MARFAPLRTDNVDLNRVQDELARKINPALERISQLGARPVVSGSKGGNAALASLIVALEQLGLITDSTS